MAYVKTNWADYSSPYLTAANLNNIEEGIYDLYESYDVHDHSVGDPTQVAAASVVNTPAGGIAATDVQAAINELDGEKRAVNDGLVFVRADKDSDGDFDPLTSTDWDGDAYAAGNGTIDWNADFGVPVDAKMIYFQVLIKDETVGAALYMKAKVTTTLDSFYVIIGVANQYMGLVGVVAVAADGTSYYTIGGELDNVHIRVVGWYV